MFFKHNKSLLIYSYKTLTKNSFYRLMSVKLSQRFLFQTIPNKNNYIFTDYLEVKSELFAVNYNLGLSVNSEIDSWEEWIIKRVEEIDHQLEEGCLEEGCRPLSAQVIIKNVFSLLQYKHNKTEINKNFYFFNVTIKKGFPLRQESTP